ncbi:MAG: phosphatase PAP2 family protein [Gaiellaceae bacterium]
MNRVLVALCAAGLAGFALIAVGYQRDPLAGWDREVAEWVAAQLPASVEWAGRPFSWVGGWVGLTALGVVAAVLLVRERSWLDLAFFLAAYVGSQLAVLLLKEVFERSRPDAGSAVPLPESFAFPSGHAASGVASLGALAILVSERLDSPRARVRLWAAAVALGLGIGLSRIALNVHFVTDVVAGWCVGLAWLAACLLVRDSLRRRLAPG